MFARRRFRRSRRIEETGLLAQRGWSRGLGRRRRGGAGLFGLAVGLRHGGCRGVTSLGRRRIGRAGGRCCGRLGTATDGGEVQTHQGSHEAIAERLRHRHPAHARLEPRRQRRQQALETFALGRFLLRTQAPHEVVHGGDTLDPLVAFLAAFDVGELQEALPVDVEKLAHDHRHRRIGQVPHDLLGGDLAREAQPLLGLHFVERLLDAGFGLALLARAERFEFAGRFLEHPHVIVELVENAMHQGVDLHIQRVTLVDILGGTECGVGKGVEQLARGVELAREEGLVEYRDLEYRDLQAPDEALHRCRNRGIVENRIEQHRDDVDHHAVDFTHALATGVCLISRRMLVVPAASRAGSSRCVPPSPPSAPAAATIPPC